jgi:hypothetical protein
MRDHMLSIRLFANAIMVVASTAVLSGCATSRTDVATALATTIANSDRVVIFENATDSGREAGVSVDADVVAAGNATSELTEGFQCLCNANMVVIWYRNDEPTCTVGLQPDGSLSWPGGPVIGDAMLPKAVADDLRTQLYAAFHAGTPLPGYYPPVPE